MKMSTDFESHFISVTNFRLVCLLPIVYIYICTVVDRRVMGAEEYRTAPMMQHYDIQIHHYRSHTD